MLRVAYWGVLLTGAMLHAQAPAAPPAEADLAFEVASIRPAAPDMPGRGVMNRGRQVNIVNYSLGNMIAVAYGIHQGQIAKGPAWLGSDRFDIVATPATQGAPTQDQLRSMLRKLLAERFNLAFHHEQRELSVYAIRIGKTGAHKLKPADPNGTRSLYFHGRGNLPARKASLADLALVLQNAVVDRPVVDQTGISGTFDFDLTWTPDEFQYTFDPPRAAGPAQTDAAPDLYTAFQNQLGLKLELTKAPGEVFIIDKAERPSAN